MSKCYSYYVVRREEEAKSDLLGIFQEAFGFEDFYKREAYSRWETVYHPESKKNQNHEEVGRKLYFYMDLGKDLGIKEIDGYIGISVNFLKSLWVFDKKTFENLSLDKNLYKKLSHKIEATKRY